MPRFVALLRGVNVGGRQRVPMADWRAQLQGLGYTGVATLLNSGNAVFSSTGRSPSAHAGRIHQALIDGLGLDVAVVVKTCGDWSQVLAQLPWPEAADDPSRLLVALAPDALTLQGLAPIATATTAPDRAWLGPQALYLHCAGGILESAAAKAVLGRAGRQATSRNWGTVLKLQGLLQAGAG